MTTLITAAKETMIPGAILIVEISKACIFAFYCKKKGKKFWQPQIETWRPKVLVKSPHGEHVKKLISDPVLINMLHSLTKTPYKWNTF